MNRTPEYVRLIVPLQSARPSGMGIAAAGAERFLRELQPGYRSPRINRCFQRLNDSILPGAMRMSLRLLLAQVAPLLYRGRLIFASHHAPLWRTGRHALIIHDLIALHHPEQHPIQTRFFRWFLPRMVTVSARVITISETMREELLRMTQAKPDAVSVIPSYSRKIDEYRPATTSSEERRERREFLFVGANFLHKKLDTAVAAVRELSDGEARRAEGPASSRRRLQEARLVVVGCRRPVWETKRIPFADLEKEGLLEVSEYASEEDLEKLYRRVTALVYIPSTEGMGLPPLEAMAAGCPVICSDIPVLRETCGEAAFFVQREVSALADFLRRLLAGELDLEVERKRELGFDRARHFSADALREKWRATVSLEFMGGGFPLSEPTK